MALETGTYISDLNAANPTAADPKSAGDDHIRLLKSTVKATFPNLTGAVTATHGELNKLAGATATTAEINKLAGLTATTAELNKLAGATPTTAELNRVAGVTSAIQGQIDAKAPLASPALTGTPTAPTAAAGTSSTQIATTAFVNGVAFSSSLPAISGASAGKFVTNDGVVASWGAVPPSGLVLLAAATVGAPVANIDFLNVFSGTYDDYLVLCGGLCPSVDDSLKIQAAVAGVVDSGSNYVLAAFSGTTASATASSAGLSGTAVAAAGRGLNSDMAVLNTNSAAKIKTIRSISTHQNSTGYATSAYTIPYLAANAISGFRLFWSAGANFTAGTVRVYGITKN